MIAIQSASMVQIAWRSHCLPIGMPGWKRAYRALISVSCTRSRTEVLSWSPNSIVVHMEECTELQTKPPTAGMEQTQPYVRGI